MKTKRQIMFKKVLILLCAITLTTNAKEPSMSSIYDFKVKTIEGKETTLAPYKGKVMLIVNVASKCGYTPQYDGLQTLYEKYHEKGLVILGFPCNQFANQEPGTEEEIQHFCRVNFGVTFPMFSKIEVNGENTPPLYAYLKSEQTGILGTEAIKWNFTKFLVDREGKVVARFGPSTKPNEIEEEIEKLLNQ
jgi:glutathione peroxidase